VGKKREKEISYFVTMAEDRVSPPPPSKRIKVDTQVVWVIHGSRATDSYKRIGYTGWIHSVHSSEDKAYDELKDLLGKLINGHLVDVSNLDDWNEKLRPHIKVIKGDTDEHADCFELKENLSLDTLNEIFDYCFESKYLENSTRETYSITMAKIK